ncbi:hypothetical protein [Natronobiforma cellulositropha]|uniref:hypothetical protein n=1 Tax=Natronobiforma cellulositropha TaxID=1679076 RepID=UPI0021D57302|nr:hypothetical protein [Natronobiforma cellulositropha]
MNRRTLLRTAGATVPVACLAGCLSNLSFTTPVEVQVRNRIDESRNVRITAIDGEDGRGTYEQSVAVTPGETAGLERLSNTDQHVRIEVLSPDGEEVDIETLTVGERSRAVTVSITDEGVSVDHNERDPPADD